jgi:hypothetical protein
MFTNTGSERDIQQIIAAARKEYLTKEDYVFVAQASNEEEW